MRLKIIYFIILINTIDLRSQIINTEFGKNRVQFHDDFKNWWQYETENFITYWYGKGRFIAQPVIQMAEQDHDEIQKVLEHRMNDKIEIIVYVDVSDLKQSNIGTEETFINKTGETKIVGNKMFVYFDGNHLHLRQKIKEGIANVYFNNMLFGSNLQEIIQNAVLMNIPEWYRQGVVSYAASSWNHLVEDELRDIWQRDKKMRDFSRLSEHYPRLAGHSFWFFIDQNFGKSAISNLLYLTKISRGTDNSFEYILNADLPSLKEDWEKFYNQYFEAEKEKFVPKPKLAEIKLANKKFTPISSLKLSPDGEKLLYVYNDQGKYKVVIRDLKTGAEKRIFKYGYKNVFQETDFNYPILAWHPNNQEISLIYEHNDVIKLMKYNVRNGVKAVQTIPTDFQRIYSLSYIDDLNYIFSANLEGLSDLFLYKSKNRNYERITDDYFDDLDAEFINYKGKQGVMFASNRTIDSIVNLKFDTILPLANYDIYFLPTDSKKAERITFTSEISERFPYLVGQHYISYIADATGIENSYVYNIDKKTSYAVSNIDRNLIRHHSVKGNNKYITTYYKDGMYKFYLETLDPTTVVQTEMTQSRASIISTIVNENIIIPKALDDKRPAQSIETGFLFQSEFSDPKVLEPIKSTNTHEASHSILPLKIKQESNIKKSIEPYNNTRAVAANKKFGLNNIVTKLDNDILFEGLESYTGNTRQLQTSPLGILLKGNIKDLFEDYTIEAGVRIPTTFNGSEFFLVFDNKKSRIDKKIAIYRKSTKYNTIVDPNSNYIQRSKKSSLLGLYQLKYPFDIYRSIRATTTLRFDRYLQLSTENNSFLSPAINEKRLSIKLEYIYDNTHDASLNIKNGSRYKIFTEFINQFNIEIVDGFKFDASKGFTGILGFDARHYIPVVGKSVLALRASGATSFGSKKMLYYIGGVENWLLPKFDNSIPTPNDDAFSYKTNAFNMRGFSNNIRNGATFLMTNIEFRFPFMQYILGKNRGTSFFKNMQLVGFYDAGLAFHGTSPFSKENPLNQVTITSPPLIQLQIEYFRDPLVMGFGAGLRTQLLGYFVKADYAWGIETRAIQKPVLYLSFGMDF
ncbi:MAG: hypothetical protein IPO92_21110 [Saprospiraceae bacterium]|nr:hypothetical protein [Saprospiraceae bacterium]